MRKLGSSNDFGISLQGKLSDKGNIGYNLMIANGTSQKPENNGIRNSTTKYMQNCWIRK